MACALMTVVPIIVSVGPDRRWAPRCSLSSPMGGLAAKQFADSVGNATTNDLWAALSEASGKDVTQWKTNRKREP